MAEDISLALLVATAKVFSTDADIVAQMVLHFKFTIFGTNRSKLIFRSCPPKASHAIKIAALLD